MNTHTHTHRGTGEYAELSHLILLTLMMLLLPYLKIHMKVIPVGCGYCSIILQVCAGSATPLCHTIYYLSIYTGFIAIVIAIVIAIIIKMIMFVL
jgi:hypothetical protein